MNLTHTFAHALMMASTAQLILRVSFFYLSILFTAVTQLFSDQIRRACGLSCDEKTLLFVGRFTHKKGLQKLESLARQHPTWTWLCIGDGEIRPEDWRLPNVRVLPSLPQAELRQYYIAADIFVLPSVGEGFPLAAQEALSCGLPVALDRSTARAFADAPIVQFDAENVENISTKLEDVLSDSAQIQSLRAQSVEYAKRWNWDETALRYETIFFGDSDQFQASLT
ncbi:MAG: hypothetical protein DDG60_12420 [Anaerolineae bacterium]|nr:MAG: hypothetical protein DDG60_12420 [Anaerolineae bacterium]